MNLKDLKNLFGKEEIVMAEEKTKERETDYWGYRIDVVNREYFWKELKEHNKLR